MGQVSACWLDGEFVAPQAARVGVEDGGLLRGEGAFETIRVEGGRAFFLGRHAARLRAGCRRLRLPAPPDDGALAAVVAGLVARAPAAASSGRLRLTRTAAHLLATLEAWSPPPPGPRTLWLAPWRLASRSPVAGIKTTSHAAWSLAAAAAREAGADDALLLNERDEAAETSRANLVALLDPEDGGALVTPDDASGALPGVARAVLLAATAAAARPLVPRPIPLALLLRARALAATNVLRGVEPVGRLLDADGAERATFDAAHPALGELDAAWRAARAADAAQ